MGEWSKSMCFRSIIGQWGGPITISKTEECGDKEIVPLTACGAGSVFRSCQWLRAIGFYCLTGLGAWGKKSRCLQCHLQHGGNPLCHFLVSGDSAIFGVPWFLHALLQSLPLSLHAFSFCVCKSICFSDQTSHMGLEHCAVPVWAHLNHLHLQRSKTTNKLSSTSYFEVLRY
jgi:hypothetical protein